LTSNKIIVGRWEKLPEGRVLEKTAANKNKSKQAKKSEATGSRDEVNNFGKN